MNLEKPWGRATMGLAMCVALAGCEKDPYRIVRTTGKLTCEGEPVEKGSISLFPDIESAIKHGRSKSFPGKWANVVLGTSVYYDEDQDDVFVFWTSDPKDGAHVGRYNVHFRPPPDLPDDFPCTTEITPKEVTVTDDPDANHFEFKLVAKSDRSERDEQTEEGPEPSSGVENAADGEAEAEPSDRPSED